MDVFNIICGTCSVVGLFVSIFTASKVVKIAKTINCGNIDDHSSVRNSGKDNVYNGSFAGRDVINGTRSGEQK